jgi:hypothetical protein
MARKAFVADEAMRERVRYLAGVGVPQDDIARIVGCAPKTLRKRFRDDLDRGIAEANATVCGYLFAAAKAGNISAIIFWLKSRVHWRERGAADAAPTPADAAANSPVLLVLPDNSRDAELTQVLREAQEQYFSGKPFEKSDPVSSQSEEGRTGTTEAGIPASAYAAATLFPDRQGQRVSAAEA